VQADNILLHLLVLLLEILPRKVSIDVVFLSEQRAEQPFVLFGLHEVDLVVHELDTSCHPIFAFKLVPHTHQGRDVAFWRPPYLPKRPYQSRHVCGRELLTVHLVEHEGEREDPRNCLAHPGHRKRLRGIEEGGHRLADHEFQTVFHESRLSVACLSRHDQVRRPYAVRIHGSLALVPCVEQWRREHEKESLPQHGFGAFLDGETRCLSAVYCLDVSLDSFQTTVDRLRILSFGDANTTFAMESDDQLLIPPNPR